MCLLQKVKELIDEKLLKFIIVGIINTLVGSAIMFGLYNLAGCSYWLSSAANYILTSVLSFFLNKYFTFQCKRWSWMQAIRFTVNIFACYILAYGMAKPFTLWLLSGADEHVQTNIAMLVGMVIFTGLNYLGQRLFAFKVDKENKKV